MAGGGKRKASKWSEHVKETGAAMRRGAAGKVVMLKEILQRASKTYKKSAAPKTTGVTKTRRKCKGGSKKKGKKAKAKTGKKAKAKK
jgi:hypothetical protein